MLIHFFIIPNLMAKHHARRDGAAWLIPVLAHPAHKNGHMVARQPHVLARRAHRKEGRGGRAALCARAPRTQDLLVPGLGGWSARWTRAVAARPAATRALSKEHPSGKRNCAGDAESGQARGAGRTAWRPWDQDPVTRRLSGRAGGCGRWRYLPRQ